MITKENLQIVVTNRNNNLFDLSLQHPVLLVFLRHFGCIFCRESMMVISREKESLEQQGIHLVMVHMSENEIGEKHLADYGLSGVEHISDPECRVYAMFGLAKGSFSQLFGLKVFIRGTEVALKNQIYPNGKQIGDGFQMPGVFLLKNGEIKSSFIHKSIADKPNYEELVKSCLI